MKSRYLLFQKTEALLIEEKAQKLFGITRLLDRHLTSDYDLLIHSFGSSSKTREDKISVLRSCLSPYTDLVAEAFPGIGVGYYSRDLRAILTYGPSSQFGEKVGLDLGPDHLGWQAMETGKEMVGIGSMVRGEIMNCMRPIIREGRAIGFVWANETLEDIYAQIQLGAKRVFFSQDTEAILGLTGLLLFSSRILLSKENAKGAPLSFGRTIEKLHSYVRFFLDSLSLGVILSDQEGKVVFISKGTGELLGKGYCLYQGYDVDKFLSELGLNPYTILEDHINGAKGRFLNTNLTKGSSSKMVTVISSAVDDLGHVIILEDLDNARAQEERLERAERLSALGELAAAIAHEIRNPLTIVKGAASLVPDRLSDPQFLARFSEIASSELERMNKTLDALLNFSRYSSPRKTSFAIENAVKKACDVISGYALAHKALVILSLGENLPLVRGDENHLIQAFLNLLLNSIQAMPKGGKIWLDVFWQPDSPFIQVSIKDQGIGIPPENKERVFDMFFTTKRDGTGLGLPLVQRIIYEHEGFVEVESEVDKGTVFVIKLPAVRKDSQDAAAPELDGFSVRGGAQLA